MNGHFLCLLKCFKLINYQVFNFVAKRPFFFFFWLIGIIKLHFYPWYLFFFFFCCLWVSPSKMVCSLSNLSDLFFEPYDLLRQWLFFSGDHCSSLTVIGSILVTCELCCCLVHFFLGLTDIKDKTKSFVQLGVTN